MQFAQFLIIYSTYSPCLPLLGKFLLLSMIKHIFKTDQYSPIPNFEIFTQNDNILNSLPSIDTNQTATKTNITNNTGTDTKHNNNSISNILTTSTPTTYSFKIATYNVQGF